MHSERKTLPRPLPQGREWLSRRHAHRPAPRRARPLLDFLDFAGIAVFALSGALLAAEKRQTLVTFVFFAVVTGVGGGTVRDLLIGAPVFWVHENATLLICLAAALVVWLTPERGSGTAGPCSGSMRRARRLTPPSAPPRALPSASRRCRRSRMGVLTGCLGGIIRDVLAGEPSILMRPELYVTAAALSAARWSGCCWPACRALAGLIAAVAGFALRGPAIRRGWSLPATALAGPDRRERPRFGRLSGAARARAATGRHCASRRACSRPGR